MLFGSTGMDPQTRDTDRGKPEVYPAGEYIRKEPTVLQSLFFNRSRGRWRAPCPASALDGRGGLHSPSGVAPRATASGHQTHELIEQVGRIMGPWRGLRVILDGKNRP